MPLQETSGNVTTDAYGGGVAAKPKYIEDYFVTWLRSGTGASTTVTTGLDASANKALVWTKSRSTATNHKLTDTVRGATKALTTSSYLGQTTDTNGLTAFSSTGYTIGSDANYNNSGRTYVDWEFVATPKFFDIVTYTGDGTSSKTINHSLNAQPGMIIIKSTVAASMGDWATLVRNGNTYYTYMYLNSTAGAMSSTVSQTSAASSTTVNVGWLNANLDTVNDSGVSYVAYLFAHNAGGFGLTGTDNVISCGSFTSDGSGNASVTLGYEPQWVMFKSTAVTGDWYILDNMRGWNMSANDNYLLANTSGAEATYQIGNPTSTGFDLNSLSNSTGYIYIAIRRGPMKVPTDATKVFSPNYSSVASNPLTLTTNFPIDLQINSISSASIGDNKKVFDRLRGTSTSSAVGLSTNLTSAESTYSSSGIGVDSNVSFTDNNVLAGSPGYYGIYWNWRRAPSFFDEVCYTGDGTRPRYIAHNLGVAPELIIVKNRSTGSTEWVVSAMRVEGTQGNLWLDSTSAAYQNSGSVTVSSGYTNISNSDQTNFYVGSTSATLTYVNTSGSNYVAYLFASCPNVSKVGYYTGNGSTQTIDCGFSGGARFVLIKRYDTTGGWYVYDTARGMTTLTDPYLFLNSSAAETATLGSVTTVSTGFALNAAVLAAINTNGGEYIFLAIA